MFREEVIWYNNVLKPKKSMNKMPKVPTQALNIANMYAWLEQ